MTSGDVDSIYRMIDDGIREGRITYADLRRLERRLDREASFAFYRNNADYMRLVESANADWDSLWDKYIGPVTSGVKVLTDGERREMFTIVELEADVIKFNLKHEPTAVEVESRILAGIPIRTDGFSVIVMNPETRRPENASLERVDYLGLGSEIVVKWLEKMIYEQTKR